MKKLLNIKQYYISGRVDYIDIAKAMAIILVLYGHVVADETLLKNIIYSFHMPLFFILSGMVVKQRESYSIESFRMLIQKRFFSIVVPYIAWAVIYMNLKPKNLIYVLYGSWQALRKAGGTTGIWFFTALFIAGLLVELILCIASRIKLNKYVIPVAGCILFIVGGYYIPHLSIGDPWQFDIAVVSAGFMLIGYCIRPLIDKLKNSGIWISLAICLFSMAAFAYFVRYSTSEKGYVLMADAVYGSLPVFVLNSLLGSVSIIGAACFFDNILKKKAALLLIGQNTLPIFVIHRFYRDFARKAFTILGIKYSSLWASSLIVVFMLVCSIITFCLLCPALPILFGKKAERKAGK